MSVKIYTSQECVYCKLAKEFFRKNKIKYEEKNITDDEEAADEVMEKTHQLGVPVIEINGEIFVGFDKEGISKALNL